MKYIIRTTALGMENFINENVKKATVGRFIYFTDESKSKTVNKKKVLQKLVDTTMRIGESYENKVNNRTDSDFKAESPRGLEYVNPFFFRAIKKGDMRLNTYKGKDTKALTVLFNDGAVIDRKDAEEQKLFTNAYYAPKTTVGRGEVSEGDDFYVARLAIEKLLVFKYAGKTIINTDALNEYMKYANVEEVAKLQDLELV